jgi:hypothetical protein
VPEGPYLPVSTTPPNTIHTGGVGGGVTQLEVVPANGTTTDMNPNKPAIEIDDFMDINELNK